MPSAGGFWLYAPVTRVQITHILKKVLYRSGYSKSTCPRIDNQCTGCGIPCVGCRRDGYLSGNGCEQSGCLIVGVVGRFCPCSAVEGDGDILEYRKKSISEHNTICFSCLRVAGILYDKGVGELTVFCDCGRRERFAYCKKSIWPQRLLSQRL